MNSLKASRVFLASYLTGLAPTQDNWSTLSSALREISKDDKGTPAADIGEKTVGQYWSTARSFTKELFDEGGNLNAVGQKVLSAINGVIPKHVGRLEAAGFTVATKAPASTISIPKGKRGQGGEGDDLGCL